MKTVMKIAVASQNRKNVTGHTGKCRKFWIDDTEARAVKTKALLELPCEPSFHEHHGTAPHPLADAEGRISDGAGAVHGLFPPHYHLI